MKNVDMISIPQPNRGLTKVKEGRSREVRCKLGVTGGSEKRYINFHCPGAPTGVRVIGPFRDHPQIGMSQFRTDDLARR
jgi:hypothetical protein